MIRAQQVIRFKDRDSWENSVTAGEAVGDRTRDIREGSGGAREMSVSRDDCLRCAFCREAEAKRGNDDRSPGQTMR